MSLKICARPCDTCIFGPNSPISKRRLAEILRTCHERDTHQFCHHFIYDRVTGDIVMEEVVCRGFYDRTLHGRGSQMIRIAERLGGIEFVEPPSVDELRTGAGTGRRADTAC